MSRLRREIYSKKLNQLLAMADDYKFFRMIWAVNALQSGGGEQARSFLSFPNAAETSDISSKYAIFPWKLEVLINEILRVPKQKMLSRRPMKLLDCTKFQTVTHLSNALGKVENADDALTLAKVDVFRELHRLGQRQFEWQRGFIHIPLFYRSHFLYGGDLTREYFSNTYGVSLEKFTLICFALRAMLVDKPAIDPNTSFELIGIVKEEAANAIRMVTVDLRQARSKSVELRSAGGHISYKKSLLRMFPCVSFSDHGGLILCPLPDLIMLRITSGIFYDVVSGGEKVRNEISARFENYALRFMQAMLNDYVIEPAYKYKVKKNDVDAPDIILREDGEVAAIFECKATRMSYEARYSEDPIADARRGYEEIAKGVFQIWRFISHHRRGLLAKEIMKSDVIGVVLTLDTWLSNAEVMQQDVLALARLICLDKDQMISADDQIEIQFCSIDDLEYTLNKSSGKDFVSVLRLAVNAKYKGWMLSSVFQDSMTGREIDRNYPFLSQVADVLPWWSTLPAGADNRGATGHVSEGMASAES